MLHLSPVTTTPRKRLVTRARRVVATVVSVGLLGMTHAALDAVPAAATFTESDFEVDRHDLEFILHQIRG